ncbi:regulatory protein [Streptomyces xiamenensis]|uniref:Regulatory protein n=1 Tax=Streptomyces xiamenensis TaxID=408015 RepID=A0A0F7FSN2_9ACTN|nr:regulatory protein [Streptomyces xiamenensis]
MQWRKSSYSSGDTGACLETQITHDRLIAIGDSKDRSRGAFVFSGAAWSVFLRHVKG